MRLLLLVLWAGCGPSTGTVDRPRPGTTDSGGGDGAGDGGSGGDGGDGGDGSGGSDGADGGDGGNDTGDPPEDLSLRPCMNELMPSNESTVLDETGAAADWVEIHNPGSEAINLEGWLITDDRAAPDKHKLGDIPIEAGGFALLWGDGLPELGPDHLSFRLSSLGGELGLTPPGRDGVLLSYGEMVADFALARQTDCCMGEGCFETVFRGTPGITNDRGTPTTLISDGAEWRYGIRNKAPTDDWADLGYDDSEWDLGEAPLGWGDPHIVTAIGPTSDGAVTARFRRSFTVAEGLEFVGLEGSLMRDDGAAVYFDGVEVLRHNLPTGDLDYTTLASASAAEAEETWFWAFELDPALLTPGEHVIAVEVHQATTTSSDMGFDLSLTGLLATAG